MYSYYQRTELFATLDVDFLLNIQAALIARNDKAFVFDGERNFLLIFILVGVLVEA
jgi:hypothetical protein